MQKKIIEIFMLLLTLTSLTVSAEVINMQDLPQGALEYMHKYHPKAKGIHVQEKTHFGQPFYQVTFKESKTDQNNTPYEDEMGELFRPNGQLFTNIIVVEKHSFNVISDQAVKTLQSTYPNHKILAVKMINNPNRYCEEYDIDLMVSGNILEVTVDNNGTILNENRK